MNQLRLYLGIVVVSSLLSSCTWGYRLGPVWYLHVQNRAKIGAEYSDITFEPCAGGLQGKVTLPDAGVINQSARVLPDKENHNEFLHGSRGGAPIVFEAWCYSEGQIELGYIKFETRIATLYTVDGGSLEVYPPPRDPSLLCASATEMRGEELPCLSGFSFDG